jgi:hypothetical protein
MKFEPEFFFKETGVWSIKNGTSLEKIKNWISTINMPERLYIFIKTKLFHGFNF